MTASSERIEYIDALRGFTMLLVVFHHIMQYGLEIMPESSVCSSLFVAFRMPLFFFISGFIASRAGEIRDRKTWAEKVRKKISVQLLPTLVFGVLFTYVVQHGTIGSFLMHRWKFGYWFTISLMEIFLIYYTIVYLTGTLSAKRNNGGGNRAAAYALGAAAVALYLLKYALKSCRLTDTETDLFCLQDTFFFFQFFVFGNIFARFRSFFEKLLDGKYFLTVVIAVYPVLFWALTNAANTGSHPLLQSAGALLCNYCGLLIVFSCFRRYRTSFAHSKPLGRTLQYIGRRTLDIYMLHYFLLPHLPEVGEYFRASSNFVLELATGIGLALPVIGICLIASNIIRLSAPLGRYLFGVKTASK